LIVVKNSSHHYFVCPVVANCCAAGLPDGIFFLTKNTNSGTFWKVLQSKKLEHFKEIGTILLLFDIFCGHLVYFTVIWYITTILVICTKKNLAARSSSRQTHFLSLGKLGQLSML
jgi:hypothetical protein